MNAEFRPEFYIDCVVGAERPLLVEIFTGFYNSVAIGLAVSVVATKFDVR